MPDGGARPRSVTHPAGAGSATAEGQSVSGGVTAGGGVRMRRLFCVSGRIEKRLRPYRENGAVWFLLGYGRKRRLRCRNRVRCREEVAFCGSSTATQEAVRADVGRVVSVPRSVPCRIPPCGSQERCSRAAFGRKGRMVPLAAGRGVVVTVFGVRGPACACARPVHVPLRVWVGLRVRVGGCVRVCGTAMEAGMRWHVLPDRAWSGSAPAVCWFGPPVPVRTLELGRGQPAFGSRDRV